MKNMITKKYISLIMALAVMGSFALASPALADNDKQGGEKPVVIGTVSAISGNTITVAGRTGNNDTAVPTIFTVDATNAKIMKEGVESTVSSILVGDAVVVQGTITGTNVVATTIRDGKNQADRDLNGMRPNLVGKVSAISGNILTVVSKQGFVRTASVKTTTFTVDATNAKILRGDTTIAITDIAIDDTVVVQGAVTGTNVVATTIRDGKVGNGENGDNNALLQIQGDGQPVVAGKIATISGSTLTITNSNNVTYTIDATSAKILQGKDTILVTGLKVDDLVIVQGAVNGTSITASTIIDQTNAAGETAKPKENKGFFNSIIQFFRNLFKF